jgi:hypothetical protein
MSKNGTQITVQISSKFHTIMEHAIDLLSSTGDKDLRHLNKPDDDRINRINCMSP